MYMQHDQTIPPKQSRNRHCCMLTTSSPRKKHKDSKQLKFQPNRIPFATCTSAARRQGCRHKDSPENLIDLVDLRVPREHGRLGHHLGQDRPHRPQIEGRGVRLAPQQDLWGAVPDSHHLQQAIDNNTDKQIEPRFKCRNSKTSRAVDRESRSIQKKRPAYASHASSFETAVTAVLCTATQNIIFCAVAASTGCIEAAFSNGHCWPTSWVRGRTGGQKALARPKSAILRVPSRLTRRFWGFRSLRAARQRGPRAPHPRPRIQFARRRHDTALN